MSPYPDRPASCRFGRRCPSALGSLAENPPDLGAGRVGVQSPGGLSYANAAVLPSSDSTPPPPTTPSSTITGTGREQRGPDPTRNFQTKIQKFPGSKKLRANRRPGPPRRCKRAAICLREKLVCALHLWEEHRVAEQGQTRRPVRRDADNDFWTESQLARDNLVALVAPEYFWPPVMVDHCRQLSETI